MGLSTLARPGKEFSFTLLAEGRFYYLSLVGFLIILSSSLFLSFLFMKRRRSPQIYSALILFPFILTSFFYFASSFSLCQKWRELTNGKDRELIELAEKTIQNSPSIADGIKVYFLNTQSHSQYFREFGDAVLKTLAPQDSKLIHSLVFTEKPPWYNFVLKEDIEKIKTAPLCNMKFRGKDFPPLVVGRLAYFYFIFPDSDEIVTDERAIFLEFSSEEKRFIDITEKVRSGRKKIRFFNDRPDA